jgi:hypothetical protein
MNHSGTQQEIWHDTRELSVCAWIGFWAQFALLAAFAAVGAFFAGANEAPGDQTCGVILIVAAALLAFLRLKNWFDNGSAGWGSFLLVDDLSNLLPMIVIFTILGLAGLFTAAGVEYGGLHNGGVALFVASGIGVFLSLKNVFDNLYGGH